MVSEITGMTTRRAFWRSHVEAQAASGFSGARYCRERALKLASFYRWRKLLSASSAHSASVSAFTEIRMEAPAPSRVQQTQAAMETPVEIVLENGRTLRVWTGFDASVLARALAIAEGADAC